MRTTIAFLFALGAATEGIAQVNDKGRFQLGLGTSLGVHKTDFEFSATYPFVGRLSKSTEDDAATVSFPLDLQVGLSRRFSLGICIEPGRYVDSSGTHPNGFFIFSLEPRYYLVNGEHFAVHVNADLGISALRISDVQSGTKKYEDSYAGGHIRFGAQAQYYFGNTFGLNFGFKIASHNMSWRDRDPEDTSLKALDYAAVLKTTGVQFQLGAQVKF